MICSDCGFPVEGVTEATIAKGSSVREPGEVVCGSCNSTRVKLVREVDKLPKSLNLIRAKRMVRT